MNDVVEEALVIQKKGQDIHVTHTGSKWLKSDHKKLRYILVNLLTNAIKYSSENTTINLNSKNEGNEVNAGTTFTIQLAQSSNQ
jgi:signal transduction histidine kinase